MSARDRSERVDIYHTVTDPDGSKRTERAHTLERVGTDEAGVIERLVSTAGSPRQRVTHYRAARSRPRDYPTDFPFLADTETWLTQFPDNDQSTGARWLCAEVDVDPVLTELEAQSREAGWEPSGMPPDWPHEVHSKALRAIRFMRRNAELRMLICAEADSQWIVQLLDSPWSVQTNQS